eukprot:CAMPEP_0184872474 /NCGR_PEP_ID=MMETSP0580-20130426/41309_1 /TAXON_ID=1118495 /ORGANISM="Dactyliosolen fragilissimus" /LENGTH=1055 /DNA_ID=CAMNT_0027375275 /DNA_START=248 /DNA_END=3415 /DNA_ORIENTATION=-
MEEFHENGKMGNGMNDRNGYFQTQNDEWGSTHLAIGSEPPPPPPDPTQTQESARSFRHDASVYAFEQNDRLKNASSYSETGREVEKDMNQEVKGRRSKRAKKHRKRHIIPGPAGVWYRRHRNHDNHKVRNNVKPELENLKKKPTSKSSSPNSVCEETFIEKGLNRDNPKHDNQGDSSNPTMPQFESKLGLENDGQLDGTNPDDLAVSSSTTNPEKKRKQIETEVEDDELLGSQEHHKSHAYQQQTDAWDAMCVDLERYIPDRHLFLDPLPSSRLYRRLVRSRVSPDFLLLHEIIDGTLEQQKHIQSGTSNGYHKGDAPFDDNPFRIPLIVFRIESVHRHGHCDWTADLSDECSGSNDDIFPLLYPNKSGNVDQSYFGEVNDSGNIIRGQKIKAWIQEKLVKDHPEWVRPGVVLMCKNLTIAAFPSRLEDDQDIEFESMTDYEENIAINTAKYNGHETENRRISEGGAGTRVEVMLLIGERSVIYSWTPEDAAEGLTNQMFLELMKKRAEVMSEMTEDLTLQRKNYTQTLKQRFNNKIEGSCSELTQNEPNSSNKKCLVSNVDKDIMEHECVYNDKEEEIENSILTTDKNVERSDNDKEEEIENSNLTTDKNVEHYDNDINPDTYQVLSQKNKEISTSPSHLSSANDKHGLNSSKDPCDLTQACEQDVSRLTSTSPQNLSITNNLYPKHGNQNLMKSNPSNPYSKRGGMKCQQTSDGNYKISDKGNSCSETSIKSSNFYEAKSQSQNGDIAKHITTNPTIAPDFQKKVINQNQNKDELRFNDPKPESQSNNASNSLEESRLHSGINLKCFLPQSLSQNATLEERSTLRQIDKPSKERSNNTNLELRQEHITYGDSKTVQSIEVEELGIAEKYSEIQESNKNSCKWSKDSGVFTKPELNELELKRNVNKPANKASESEVSDRPNDNNSIVPISSPPAWFNWAGNLVNEEEEMMNYDEMLEEDNIDNGAKIRSNEKNITKSLLQNNVSLACEITPGTKLDVNESLNVEQKSRLNSNIPIDSSNGKYNNLHDSNDDSNNLFQNENAFSGIDMMDFAEDD